MARTKPAILCTYVSDNRIHHQFYGATAKRWVKSAIMKTVVLVGWIYEFIWWKKLLNYLLYWNKYNLKIITLLIIDSQLAFGTTREFSNILCVSREWQKKNKVVSAEELTFCCYTWGLWCDGESSIETCEYFKLLKIRWGQRRQLQHYRSNYLFNRIGTYNIEQPLLLLHYFGFKDVNRTKFHLLSTMMKVKARVIAYQ